MFASICAGSLEREGGPTGRLAIRATCVLGALLVSLAFAVSAQAIVAKGQLFAYGTEKGICLLSSQLETQSPSERCTEERTPWFIDGQMIDDTTGGKDYQTTTSGDYCSYHGLGDVLDKPEEANWAFGSNMPTPLSDYQMGDENANVCAAWGTYSHLYVNCVGGKPEGHALLEDCPQPLTCGPECKPEEVRGEVMRFDLEFQDNKALEENHCAEGCGMQRYVSLAQQQLEDRPWAGYLNEPKLAVEDTVEPLIFLPVSGVGWGYLCPVLEDEATGNIIELCFEEWRGSGNGTEWQHERVAKCTQPSELGHTVDRVITYFGSGTQYATEGQGSKNTAVFSTGARSYRATVSPANFENVVRADNSSAGCTRTSSVNPAKWALIGVSSGIEGWGLRQAASANYGAYVGVEFSTLPPQISSEAATEVTSEHATVSATVTPSVPDTPGPLPMHYLFEYGPTTAYGSTTPDPIASEGGAQPVPVAQQLSGLVPNTTYHYRIKAFYDSPQEPYLSAYGSDATFTTPAERPAATTGAAAVITNTSVTLKATVNPKNSNVSTCKFEYGTTVSYGSSASCSTLPGSGDSPVEVSAALTGLAEHTTYHYRIVATNSAGTSEGTDQVFTTPPFPPAVVTGVASSITHNTATLQATVNPNGSKVSTCKFEYGTTVSYGSSASCSMLPGSGDSPVEVSAALTGLAEHTTYHYRIVATNAIGTSDGADQTFGTPPYPPTVVTEAPATITVSSATLKASVNPNGTTVSTCKFEYGTTISYGSSASCSTLPGSGNSPVEVSAAVTGLKENATYHYRIVATNAIGTSDGADQGFDTSSSSQCTGANIDASGSSAQSMAQTVFSTGFNTSENANACDGLQGSKQTPAVSYSPLDSSAPLEAWGINNHAFEGTEYHAFIGTEEPPNAIVKEEVQAHSKHPSEKTLETIPVLQGALAIIVRLPEGCSATSNAYAGRLVLDNVTLEKLWRGVVTKWSELTDDGDKLSGSSCARESAITRIVPYQQAGTTAILKKYLANIYSESVIGERNWKTLAEGSYSVEWPGTVVRPLEANDEGVVRLVSSTPGSIGFANLADVRRNPNFIPPTGGAYTARFWVPIQNNGLEQIEETYADPSTNADSKEVANANCLSTSYIIGNGGEVPYPPTTTTSSYWSEVTTKSVQEHYPLCALMYDLAFSEYSQYSYTTSSEAKTVHDYLNFVLAVGGGQEVIKKHDYSALPGSLLSESREGAEKIKF